MELAQARKARIVPRTGGRALADALVAQGIDHVFAVPAESFLDVLDGLYDVRQKLKLVTVASRPARSTWPEAFGKLKGGPGGRECATWSRRADMARSACTSRRRTARRCCSSSARSHTKTWPDVFEEIDYRRMFSPLAKWVTQIDQAKPSPKSSRRRWMTRCRDGLVRWLSRLSEGGTRT